MRRLAAVLSAAAMLSLGLGVGTGATARAAGPPLTRIGQAPALPAGASAVGALAQSASINATVTLDPRDPAALATYAQAVSTPGSAVYRHYLTVDQFAQRFAPGAAEVASVRAALRAQGLNPGPLAANGLSLGVSGSASQLSAAFSTSFERYRVRGGRIAFANTSAPAVPASVARLVQGVVGLDSLQLPTPAGLHKLRATQRGMHTSAAGLRPSTTAPGEGPPCTQASAGGAHTAGQIASAYGLSDLYTAGDAGSGTTIAVFELEPYAASDIQAYQQCYGTSVSVTNQAVDGGTGTALSQGEAALDIEDLIGLAPRASIVVYEGPNTGSGAYDTYRAIVTQSHAQVISTSWGLCEASQGSSAARAENILFQEAATQGQSIFAASGDNGVQDCGPNSHTRTVDDPASQPYVTGVGGTSLNSVGPPAAETVWNSTWSGGSGAGGGGVSTLWGQPSYQSGAAVTQSSTTCGPSGTSCRQVPDVSADADLLTGYSIYYNGAWYMFGGTSAAAPTWAALAALADSSATCSGTPVGFANTSLYQAAATSYGTYFNDVTSGNTTYGGVTGFSAAPGFDLASGLGSPKGSAVAAAMCGGSALSTNAGTTTTTTTSPTTTTTTTTAPPPTTTMPVTPPTATTGTTATTTPPPAPVVALTQPAPQASQVGRTARLRVRARDSAALALRYRATGLPAGLSIARSTGLISGAVTRTGRSTVVISVSDAAGSSAVAVFVWTVTGRPSVRHVLTVDPGGRPSLSVKIGAGSFAPALHTVVIQPSDRIRFSSRTGELTRGTTVRDAGGHRLRTAVWLHGGALVVMLRGYSVRSATVVVSAPAISLAQRHGAAPRSHRPAAVRLSVTLA